MVDETEMESILAMSIQLSNESGNEEYVKQQVINDDDWDFE